MISSSYVGNDALVFKYTSSSKKEIKLDKFSLYKEIFKPIQSLDKINITINRKVVVVNKLELEIFLKSIGYSNKLKTTGPFDLNLAIESKEVMDYLFNKDFDENKYLENVLEISSDFSKNLNEKVKKLNTIFKSVIKIENVAGEKNQLKLRIFKLNKTLGFKGLYLFINVFRYITGKYQFYKKLIEKGNVLLNNVEHLKSVSSKIKKTFFIYYR